MLSKPEWLQWQRYCGKIGSVQHILEVMITQKHMGHYFKTIQIRMEHLMNCQLQELDLTSAQGHIIGYLAWSKQPPCAKDIEKFFGIKASLKLWVKVKEDWRNRQGLIHTFGLDSD